MILAVILIGNAWYRLLNSPKISCANEPSCNRETLPKWNKTILSIVTVVVIAIAGFPHLPKNTAAAVSDQSQKAAGALSGTRFEVNIPSMECSACADSIQSALEGTSGVSKASVNFNTKTAIIIYDEQTTEEDQIYQIIKQAGFKAEPK